MTDLFTDKLVRLNRPMADKMMLFSGFELNKDKMFYLRQTVEQLAQENEITFEVGRQAHLTIHYFGKEVTTDQRERVIFPVYRELVETMQVGPFGVSILPVPHLFGKEHDLLVLEMDLPPHVKRFAETVRARVVELDPSLPKPDFLTFNPHVTLGVIREADPERREAFRKLVAYRLNSVFVDEVKELIFFSTPDPITREYSQYAKIGL